MATSLRDLVRERANDCCEYCRLPQAAIPFISFHVEHIVAQQHLGGDELENLAWACHRCNGYKGPNLTSIDSETGDLVTLYRPRTDLWSDHFRWDGPAIIPTSPVGRATARVM